MVRTRALPLAGLMALAVVINLHAPTVFFDSQLMLGTSAAVLALLLFGWSGLLVGAAALTVTLVRWGHPYELLIGMGQLVWLRWYLDHLNGGPSQQTNGRIVLAAIGYWVVVGIPAEILLFTQGLGVDLIKSLGLGLKEAVVAVLSTAIGLLLYLLWGAWRGRRGKGQISIRGITFAAVLLAVSVPGILITFTLSAQLKTTALQAQRQSLTTVAAEVAAALATAGKPSHLLQSDGVAVRWRSPQGVVLGSSSPRLFERLDQAFEEQTPSRTKVVGLDLLVPRQGVPVLKEHQQAYWLVRSGAVTVVQPADPLIRQLDNELLFPSFTLLALLLLLAAALAEGLAWAVDRQFRGVITPLQLQPNADQLPDLGGSAIRELQQLVELVNGRTRRTRELTRWLQQAQDELAQSALAITEAIPVGTYTMVMRPSDVLSRFAFVSQRFLEICGVERPALMADSLAAFACVHPDDREGILALHAEACALKIPFRAQCRVVLDGVTRWVRAESIPRQLPDGSTVWEGVLIDITDQVMAQQQLRDNEQQLRRILTFLPIPVGCNRLEGSQDLVFLNQRFLETFGYSAEELPNVQAWAERAFPDPSYRQWVLQTWNQQVERSLLGAEEVGPLDLVVVCKDGSRRDVILTATVSDSLMVATFLDITERKRAEEALAKAFHREAALKEQQRLELEGKLRTSLTAAVVAHEINQPLSAILINAQMLQSQLQELPAGDALKLLKPLLALQVQEVDRIVATIEKMRMLLRNVQSDQVRIDLCDVVASAHLYLRSLLSAHRVTVDQSGFERPQWLLGDAAQLQIAIVNLMRNAVEAMDQAAVPEPHLQLTLLRSCAEDPPSQSDWLELRVADNGPGFGNLQLDQLPLTSTKPQGSGIGLFVARTAVQNHGGSLVLGRSPTLGGAEVVLRLPVLSDAPAS